MIASPLYFEGLTQSAGCLPQIQENLYKEAMLFIYLSYMYWRISNKYFDISPICY